MQQTIRCRPGSAWDVWSREGAAWAVRNPAATTQEIEDAVAAFCGEGEWPAAGRAARRRAFREGVNATMANAKTATEIVTRSAPQWAWDIVDAILNSDKRKNVARANEAMIEATIEKGLER